MDSTSRDTWLEAKGRLRLFYRTWGDDPHAPGVGIVPGLGDHSGRWERVGRTLAARGFTAYALDLPGHGRSEGRRGHVRSWEDYRDAITGWMENVRGDRARPWAFFGHSLGALIALDWTARHPGVVDAQVISAPPFELSLHPAVLKVHAARLVGRIWPSFTQGNEIPPSLLSHDPEVIRAHRADPHVHYRISARLFLEFSTIRRTLAKEASAVSVPTLLIQGGADPVTSCIACSRWAAAAPAGIVTYREYPGLFHEVLNEPQGVEILSEVISWLEDVLDHSGSGPG